MVFEFFRKKIVISEIKEKSVENGTLGVFKKIWIQAFTGMSAPGAF
jgi:hypothetical protein